jgi:hypothetical protein
MSRHALVLALFLLLALSLPASAWEVYFAPSTNPGGLGRNVSVNCDPIPEPFDNEWIGYSSTGAPPTSANPDCATADYVWTISGSSTDPFVNSGPISETSFLLWVWYACTNQNGLSAAAFDFVWSGEITPFVFVPTSGFLTVDEFPSQLFASPGCTQGPIPIGFILAVQGPVSVEETGFGELKALYR